MPSVVPHYLLGTAILGADGSTGPASSSQKGSSPKPTVDNGQRGKFYEMYDQATDEFQAVEQAVKKVHQRISPWLWIFSIWGAIGTTVAVWNKLEQLRDRDWRVW